MPWPCALGNPLCRTSVSPAIECSSHNTRGIWGGTTHPGRRLAQSCRAFSLLAPACRNTSCWDSQKYSMLSPGCPQVENHKFTFVYQERAKEGGPRSREMLARTRCEFRRSAPKPRAGKVARGVAQWSPASPRWSLELAIQREEPEVEAQPKGCV